MIKIERKSLKIDNKLTQNQWKSMKSLSKIERKSAIFQWNLDQILAQFYLILTKWDTIWNNGFGLGPQILIIKLANFLRKSMKNQWKSHEISGKIITNL